MDKMTDVGTLHNAMLKKAKFNNPDITKTGERRAWVHLSGCERFGSTLDALQSDMQQLLHRSNPTNDRLVYLTAGEVVAFLDELQATNRPPPRSPSRAANRL